MDFFLQDKCYGYWPRAGTVSYGAVHVDLEDSQREDENITVHDLRITNREVSTFPLFRLLPLLFNLDKERFARKLFILMQAGKSWSIKHYLCTK